MSTDTDVSLSSYDNNQGSKLVLIGMVGFLAVVAYGLYKWMSTGNAKMSLPLIHMCVAAQGFVVEAITVGMGCSVY
uniref:HIG1 domain family member 1A, mitochondrial-like n=1 Tax=Callithrix jacchus TaxID=9483 RepID=UPI00159E1C5D|nr:HIG1 domain family member 1A, mitochondrial-like [Callithrix jacchus]